jgi:hypothetical protein
MSTSQWFSGFKPFDPVLIPVRVNDAFEFFKRQLMNLVSFCPAEVFVGCVQIWLLNQEILNSKQLQPVYSLVNEACASSFNSLNFAKEKMKLINFFKKLLEKSFSRHGVSLFDGDDSMFKRLLSDCEVYAEYGCGASTLWVANNTACTIYSVDTSTEWIERTRIGCTRSNNINFHLTNVGPLGKWGRPLSYDLSENFEDYANWFWRGKISPDIILVDGRFRVYCFLTSLLFAKEGAKIIFDDYANRRHYHFVENFLKPVEKCGRQALFIVPPANSLDKKMIELVAKKFEYVMD